MSEDSPIVSYAAANAELVRSFERYITARGFSQRSIPSYMRAVKAFVSALDSQSVLHVDRATVRVFLASLHDRGQDPRTIQHYTAVLRAFYKFLRLAGLIRISPMLLISQRKLPHRLPRVLTIAEVEQLIAAAKTPFERAMIEVLYATGLRVSEVARVRLEDIDFEQRSIRVVKGKGGKDRTVLFGQYAEKAMREYLEWRKPTSGLLFESRAQHANADPTYSQNGIRQTLAHVAHGAGLGAVSPHVLRRSMATHMLQSGADLRVIQELLGHSLVTTTALYTRLDASDLQRTYEKCHPHSSEESKGEPSHATQAAQ